MRNFLVFEADDAYEPPPVNNVTTDYRGNTYVNRSEPRRKVLIPYTCVGAVQANDETDAARAIVSATRRIGKYAVIEATFIDFTQDINEPEAEAPKLNP